MGALKPRTSSGAWLAAAALFALLAGGCSQEALLTQADYRASRVSLERGDIQRALQRFPKGEAGDFITTMERTYLGLLQGRADIDALIGYRDVLEDRFRIHVTRELQSFFYVETPEGYYASEHEIVWMHLLLSWGYSLRDESEAACVEARSASHLLSADWSAEGHFDDPTLRSILAVMWAWCGAWDEAAVDFRAAAALDPSLEWAAALGRRETPPRNLFLVLGGVGPEPVWNPSLELNPLRGARNVGFAFRGRRSTVGVETATQLLDLHLTPGTAPWYRRHQERDNAIHELIADSRYGLDTTLEVGLATTKTAAAAAYWTTITVVGIAGGAGIVYLATLTKNGEAIIYGAIAGIAVAWAAFAHGAKVYSKTAKESGKRLSEQSNPALYYRFVRFLPEYAWIGWSDEALEGPPWLTRTDGLESEVLRPIAPVRERAPRLYLGHLPDVAPAP